MICGQLFGIDNDERQIYFRSGITDDEQTGKTWSLIDLPHRGCSAGSAAGATDAVVIASLPRDESVTSSLCSSLSMDPINSTDDAADGRSTSRSGAGGVMPAQNHATTSQLSRTSESPPVKHSPSRSNDSSPRSTKKQKNDAFGFKSGFAVSFKPASNAVSMTRDDEDSDSESEVNTDDLGTSASKMRSKTPQDLHESSEVCDSLSEGLDSLALLDPVDFIKEDGEDILWTDVSASACSITEESQIRNWFTANRGIYTHVKRVLHETVARNFVKRLSGIRH